MPRSELDAVLARVQRLLAYLGAHHAEITVWIDGRVTVRAMPMPSEAMQRNFPTWSEDADGR
jgi:hypothetical protein